MAEDPKNFVSSIQTVAAVVGENTAAGDGVFGIGHGASGRGVVGTSEKQNGVTGVASDTGVGVWGVSEKGNGAFGESKASEGVGVFGQNLSGGRGVVGVSSKATGVEGNSVDGAAVWGVSTHGEGVHGQTNSATVAAVAALNTNSIGTGAALYAKKEGDAGHAGYFDGNVHVTRDVTLSPGYADCAEHFDVADMATAEPGTVMVLGETGTLMPSQNAYDTRVAGVISGAGDYKPGIVLDKRASIENRIPIALLGKVYCKVDAQFGSIRVGDLLTTSPMAGHAMKASDPLKAFGAVIGKALRPLRAGQGLIPILITLQ